MSHKSKLQLSPGIHEPTPIGPDLALRSRKIRNLGPDKMPQNQSLMRPKIPFLTIWLLLRSTCLRCQKFQVHFLRFQKNSLGSFRIVIFFLRAFSGLISCVKRKKCWICCAGINWKYSRAQSEVNRYLWKLMNDHDQLILRKDKLIFWSLANISNDTKMA